MQNNLLSSGSEQCNDQEHEERPSCVQIMKKLFFSLVLGTIIAICWVMIIHTLKWIAIRGNEFELLNQQQQPNHHRSSAQALQSSPEIVTPGVGPPPLPFASAYMSSSLSFLSSPSSSSSFLVPFSPESSAFDQTLANTAGLSAPTPMVSTSRQVAGPRNEATVTAAATTETNSYYSELRDSPVHLVDRNPSPSLLSSAEEKKEETKKKAKQKGRESEPRSVREAETDSEMERKESEKGIAASNGQEKSSPSSVKSAATADQDDDKENTISAQNETSRLKRFTGANSYSMITGVRGSAKSSSKSENNSSSSAPDQVLLKTPVQNEKMIMITSSSASLNLPKDRRPRTATTMSTNVAAQRINPQQRQQQQPEAQAQQQHRTSERQLFQKRLMHLSSIVPQPQQQQQQQRNRGSLPSYGDTATPPIVMDTNYEDSLKSEATNGNSATSFDGETGDNLDQGQPSSWSGQGDGDGSLAAASNIPPQSSILDQQLGPNNQVLDSELLERGTPVQASLVYRAPFFTSWFVSIWNILFMPVFTLISSCCFRNEDNTTKKLLV